MITLNYSSPSSGSGASRMRSSMRRMVMAASVANWEGDGWGKMVMEVHGGGV